MNKSAHLRPSSAIRHQQHQQQQMKSKNQHASNIKIKGMQNAGAQRHAHNQSVAIVHQSGYAKQNIASIDNLSAVSKKAIQMH